MSQRSISANHFKIALFFSLIFLNNNKVFVSFRLSETHNTVATPSVSDQSQFEFSNYNDMDTDLNEL